MSPPLGDAPSSSGIVVDVLIIGAGISGIGAACHLRMKQPQRSVLILEARADLGGTWDLFRYPGIRSDSDLFTFGYDFKPWTSPRAIADGASILAYLRETAQEHGVDRLIRYRQRVTGADWSTSRQRWRVRVHDEAAGTERVVRYAGLRPGRYRFELAAANESGVWSAAPATLAFEIEPRFWQTDLFAVASTLALLALLLGAVQLRTLQLRVQRRALAAHQLAGPFGLTGQALGLGIAHGQGDGQQGGEGHSNDAVHVGLR